MDLHDFLDAVFYKDDKKTGERKVSCCKLVVVLFVVFLLIGMIGNATDSDKTNNKKGDVESLEVNVPNDFRVDENATGLQFESSERNVDIRVLDGDKDMSDGFTKYDGAILVFDKVTGVEHPLYNYALGEYVLIDGVKYWVEVSNDDYDMKSSDEVSEVMDYLNSHNTWEFVSS